MSVSGKGSHFKMPFDVATSNTVEAKKRGHQEAAPAGRVRQAPPDDTVTQDEDEVFKDATDVGEVFLRRRDIMRDPVPADGPFHPFPFTRKCSLSY